MDNSRLPTWNESRSLSLVPSPQSPRWSDWHWSAGGRIVRVNLDNIQEEEECGDRLVLEQNREILKEVRQDYLDSALKAKSKSRAKELMRGVSDKDRQIAWVEGKLRELGSGCDQSGGDRFQGSISPNKKPVDFTRGNSQESSQGISPNKKGRGKNNVPASGSLVPVVQLLARQAGANRGVSQS